MNTILYLWPRDWIRYNFSEIELGTIKRREEGGRQELGIRLEWPIEITATEFFKRLKQLPKAKGQAFFQ